MFNIIFLNSIKEQKIYNKKYTKSKYFQLFFIYSIQVYTLYTVYNTITLQPALILFGYYILLDTTEYCSQSHFTLLLFFVIFIFFNSLFRQIIAITYVMMFGNTNFSSMRINIVTRRVLNYIASQMSTVILRNPIANVINVGFQ